MSQERERTGKERDRRAERAPEGSKAPLRRLADEAVLAGVCAGIARKTATPAWLWRVIFLITATWFGLGALVYGVLWLIMKGEGPSVPPPEVVPLFRRIDWWAFGVTTVLVLIGYVYTLAPDLTLEDSGELATGSFYAGVPHPPGYPVWTIYSWLFTVLIPFSNIAWRVALSSAVAGAFASGLIALVASRGSSMILESIEVLRNIDRRLENALCMASGYVAGMLIGFNGFMWSQAVIVEVYTLSVLSLMGVLCCLLRWIYAPHQRRYLYWALFLFGICFTNHQTLIVAALGIEVAIAAANPRLGRDLFLLNSVLFILGLLLKANGMLTSLSQNRPLFIIYLAIGVVSMGAYAMLAVRTERAIGREIWTGICMGNFWILGAAFYFYMPIASMTNPPMNWGYPRTWEGFIHALTRGQYERTNPTSDLWRFLEQMGMLFNGAVDEFNLVFLLIALVPFFFFKQMKKREQAWLLGLVAMYLLLSVLLMVLLNPSADRQSREMNRVFFTASHVMIALCVGYGLAIFGGLMATHYDRFRSLALYGTTVAAAIAFYAVTVVFQPGHEALLSQTALFGLEPSHDPLVRFTAVFSLVMALAAVAIFILSPKQAPMKALLILFLVFPVKSILSHWSDNEQRGHLFGYWFGHDMFTPPFGVYPEMAHNAILFGGTDPGRFCPTYMIFCESFIPPRCKPRDPEFDRRDVYIVTQNALADGTYLNYIRAQYDRSAMIDPPFFQDMVRTRKEIMEGQTNLLAKIVAPLDWFFMGLGAKVEARRRAEGVYPPKEVYMPSSEDHARCMTEYFADAQRRMQVGQLKAGENVSVGPDGKLQVSGQVAVMAINGLLTKVIYDRNPTNEFYVEESFPLDWMFPYLEPYGIIMKINRKPVPEFTEDMVRKDHEFWRRYSERLIGDWITYDTPVKDICDFAVRVYERRDYEGFTGERKFIRDDQAQKSFSKLRSSLGGLYVWRRSNPETSAEEKARTLKEADFAFRQALAFCPYSPEAVYRYTSLLVTEGRFDDALLVAETCLRFDRGNESIRDWIRRLQAMKAAAGGQAVLPAPPDGRLAELEQKVKDEPTNGPIVFELASIYLSQGRTNRALQLFDTLIDRPNVDVTTVLSVANAYAQLQQGARLESALRRLVTITPDNPEAWYDLASTLAILGKSDESMEMLRKAIELSDARRATNPSQRDLRLDMVTNEGLLPLRVRPEYQELLDRPR